VRIHPGWYWMLLMLLLGVAGMAFGSRRKPAAVQRARWLKSASYGLIVGALFWLALRGGAPIVAAGCLIVAGCTLELWRAAASPAPNDGPALRIYEAGACILFCLLAIGFLRFLRSTGAGETAFVFFVVFCFDAFSQVAGQIAGRRPLAPSISPNKTVEGLLGGLAAALLAGWIASHWSPITLWPATAALVAASSLAGDLAGSHFKRRHGLKDFSSWVPYQGGFLDRFGSLIASCAACCAAGLPSHR
jgi:phosphatidate cytidylyltransferase